MEIQQPSKKLVTPSPLTHFLGTYSTEEPLLVPCDAEDGGRGNGAGFPWKDVALLVMVWLCFFALHVLIGDKHGKVRTARLSCLIHQLPTSSAYGMMIT